MTNPPQQAITLENIVQNPELLDQLKQQSRMIKRSHYGLERVLGYVTRIENQIRENGWNEKIRTDAYNLMSKMANIADRSPELRDSIDSMIENVYEVVKKHVHAARQYDYIRDKVGSGALKQLEGVIPSPFKPHQTDLEQTYASIKQMLDLPSKTKELEAALKDYKHKARGMGRYLTGFIALAMILGTLGAYYIGNISVTGYQIAAIDSASRGLFAVLIILVGFSLIMLRKIKFKF